MLQVVHNSSQRGLQADPTHLTARQNARYGKAQSSQACSDLPLLLRGNPQFHSHSDQSVLSLCNKLLWLGGDAPPAETAAGNGLCILKNGTPSISKLRHSTWLIR